MNDEVAQQDLHMEEVVIGQKTWGCFDYDITLSSNRGKSRAQIVQYRRRAASKDERSHNAIHIARIVMGAVSQFSDTRTIQQCQINSVCDVGGHKARKRMFRRRW